MATPVYTVDGRYTARGWTELTQGFLYGEALLQFGATGDEEALELGRRLIRDRMTSHLTHEGVHDHGFNNVSTYGNLRRPMPEGRVPFDAWELAFYENALCVSGAVQAMRWTRTADGGGFIHSFNDRRGPGERRRLVRFTCSDASEGRLAAAGTNYRGGCRDLR